MAGLSAVFDTLEMACRELKQSVSSLGWEWDGRFEAALSVYQAESSAKIRSVLDEHFNAKWNAGNIANAPADLRQLVKSLGGFRAGQELVSSDPSLDWLVAVALWPWGGGAKVSMRLWLLSKDASAGQGEDLRDRLRSWLC
jgi:hypothetical protein